MNQRTVIPLSDSFFNDGYWYVLTSTSFGGNQYSLEQIDRILSDVVDSTDEEQIEQMKNLLSDGICLPLFFDGDCALDNAVIIIGDLSEQEENEWLGCIRSKLEIPCGEFVVMGAPCSENFKFMVDNFEPDGDYPPFQKVKVTPGTYLIEVYAFIGSLTVNFLLEGDYFDEPDSLTPVEQAIADEPLDKWWQRTRPKQTPPAWLEGYLEGEYVDGEEHSLLEYLIRLAPFQEEAGADIPALEKSTNWAGVFTMRKPDNCPQGILRSSLLS